MARVEAVVFDLDDTLYAEREYVLSGFRAVAERFGGRLGDPAITAARLTRLFESGDRTRVFQLYLAEVGGEDESFAQEMVEVYRSHRPTIRLFEDADAALRTLHGRVRLGVLTDGRSATQRAKVAALGLFERVDEVLVSSELGAGIEKPDPRPFEFMATRLQRRGDRTVYIGDNAAKDFVAPNELGWRTIQVRRREGFYLDMTPPLRGRPQAILPDLACLSEQLRAWGWTRP